jgi:hypothetical protein
MSSPQNQGWGFLTQLAARLHLRLVLSHTITQHSISTPLPEPERHDFTSKKRTSLSHWEVISFPLCRLGQAWIWIQVLTSLMSATPLPLLVPVPHWVPLCIQGPHPNPREGGIPPSDQAVHWRLVGSPPGGLGGCTHNCGWAPKKCCRSLLAEIGDSEAIRRKQHFIVLVQTQWTRVQRLSPKLQAGYRGNKIKKQGLTHVWFHEILQATSA